MLGAIIGDIVGSRFERNSHKSKDFELFTDQCRFTDDTAMTVAIAKALLECNGDYTDLSNHAIRCMQEIGQKYPDAGYGRIFYQWLYKKVPGPYWSYGNGSAMRVSPVAYVAKSAKRMHQTLRCGNSGQPQSSGRNERRRSDRLDDFWGPQRITQVVTSGRGPDAVLYFGFHH